MTARRGEILTAKQVLPQDDGRGRKKHTPHPPQCGPPSPKDERGKAYIMEKISTRDPHVVPSALLRMTARREKPQDDSKEGKADNKAQKGK